MLGTNVIAFGVVFIAMPVMLAFGAAKNSLKLLVKWIPARLVTTIWFYVLFGTFLTFYGGGFVADVKAARLFIFFTADFSRFSSRVWGF